MALGGGNSGGQAIRAGGAFVELFTRDSQLRAGLQRAKQMVQKFGALMKRVGAVSLGAGLAIAAPLTAAVNKFMSVGDNLDKMSGRTGASVEFLSKLGHAAQQSGTDLETVETFLLKMNDALFDATEEGAGARKIFERLGLDFQKLAGLPIEERFLAVADAISKLDDVSSRALARDIGGRGGAGLMNLFAGGREGIVKLMEESKRIGGEWTRSMTNNARDLTDAWGRVKTAFGGALAQVGNALAPVLIRVADAISPLIARLSEWIKRNPHVIVAIGKIAAGLVALGVALPVVGTALIGVASALGVILSPVGLLTIATGGATGALGFLWSKTEEGSDVIDRAKVKLAELLSSVKSTWNGVTDAIKGGDWGLAIEIVMKSVEIAFKQGLEWLRGAWEGFTQDIRKAAFVVMAEISMGLEQAMGKNQLMRRITGADPQALEQEQSLRAGELMADIAEERVKTWQRQQQVQAELRKMSDELDQLKARAAGAAALETDPLVKRLREAQARLKAESNLGTKIANLPKQIEAAMVKVAGAFEAPSWQRSFGVADSIVKQQLAANKETALNTKGIKDALARMPLAMFK